MEKTRILSWDVGIKHLAYNLSEYTQSTDTNKIDLIIKQWGIINLSLEQCTFCDDDGLYLYENKYYCKEHCKTLRAKHFCYVEKCYDKAKYHLDVPDVNKYMCLAHGPKTYVSDNATEVLKLKLIEKLDLLEFQEFSYVLIENQPTFKNPKMKAIADTLYAWFLIRRVVDAKTLIAQNIRLISPSRKNTLFVIKPESKPKAKKNTKKITPETQEIIPEEIQEKPKKLTYQEGKKMSIEFCLKIISPEWTTFFKDFSKKDDLADCLLQGYSFYTLLISENEKSIKRQAKASIKETNLNKIKNTKLKI